PPLHDALPIYPVPAPTGAPSPRSGSPGTGRSCGASAWSAWTARRSPPGELTTWGRVDVLIDRLTGDGAALRVGRVRHTADSRVCRLQAQAATPAISFGVHDAARSASTRACITGSVATFRCCGRARRRCAFTSAPTAW